ncbi:TetR/AcrR family transcriptional regulator [Bacillus sp. NP157]|nr:TetR/AcrR family transcriptional regulator [Bacillus sp. NP157]
MGISDRKSRQVAEREARILAAARTIAENEGWPAVTVRRLAADIEYSQPVLYSHFENRDAIVAAVAIEGFAELAVALGDAARGARLPEKALAKVAQAYLDFASDRPALYEAMFVLTTTLHFAAADTPAALRAAFDALVAVVAPFAQDVEAATETVWAALHGMAELDRSGRVRPQARAARLRFLVRMVTAAK